MRVVMMASVLSRVSKKLEKVSGRNQTTTQTATTTPPCRAPPESVYQPLDSTKDSLRLLVLHQKLHEEDHDTPICTLTNVTFAQKPVYEALSYTWGKPSPQLCILLNGKEFPVQENLYLALQSLRKELADRVLWIDALCINQHDLDERAYQVSLMDYVYTRASCVVVWLGPFPPKVEAKLRGGRSYKSPEDLAVCDWLCTREYWTRLWIIQEIGLARNLKVIGSHWIDDWDHLISVLSKHGRHNERHNERRAMIEALDKKRKTRNGPSNQLHELLETFQYARCKDPRDKIYGLLGLAHDCQNGGIKVDYKISVLELYEATMKFFSERHLETSNNTTELDMCIRIVGLSHLVLKSLGGPCPRVPTAYNTSVIALGATSGEILHAGATFDEIYASKRLYKEWKLEFERHNFTPAQVSELREANEALDHYLCNCRSPTSVGVCSIDPGKSFSCGVESDVVWTGTQDLWSEKYFQTDQIPDVEPGPISNFNLETEPIMFLSSGCHIGLAPRCAQVGDVICQFWKTDVVALLRPEQDRTQTKGFHRVIGRVYLSTGVLEELKPRYSEWMTPPEGASTMAIRMDISTLYQLTSWMSIEESAAFESLL